MCCSDQLNPQHIPVIEPAKEAAAYRHAWWLEFDWNGWREGTILGVSGEISEISDALRARRRRESLYLLGGIRKIGC